jgi:hypothetical protein
MKLRALSVGIAVFLMILGISLAMFADAHALPVQKDEPLKSADYKISGPYTHENLTIFLIHGKDTLSGKKFLTLQEAMEKKVFIVYELVIENLSPSEEVYIQSGEIVKGGQQDRVLAVDLIVQPRSGRIPIAAFCVESGRWQKRGQEASAKFESSNEIIATRGLKIAANKSKSQTEVWAKVEEAQDKLSLNTGGSVNSTVSSSSLQLSLENKKVQEVTDSYIKKLSGIINGKTDVIGYAFAINGKINSSDVYGSSVLFKKLWPKLLKSSAVEALAELQKGAKYDSVHADSVKGFFASTEDGKASENAVSERIKMVTKETDDNILFETRDEQQGAAVVHRSYVKKQ